jgi:hypothetical protein
MAPDKMKPLLTLSKREPVQAAIGLTADGEAVVLLDKRAKPKKVMSMLKASAAKAKLQLNTGSLRFGRAEVDPDYDSAVVRFFLNKESGGNVRLKLTEIVKRIPYQKAEINVDPTLEDEPEEDEAGAPVAGAAQPTAAAAPAETPQLNATTLRAELAAMIKSIATVAGTDATRRAALVAIASEGNDALKGNNLEAAAQAVVRLREALEGGTVAVAWDKISAAWASTRAAASAAAKPIVKELQLLAPGTATGVENVLNSYGNEVEGLLKTASGGNAEAGIAQVQSMVEALRAEMAGDQLFAYLDGNGVSVRPAFLAGFDQIETLLRPAAGA